MLDKLKSLLQDAPPAMGKKAAPSGPLFGFGRLAAFAGTTYEV